MGPAILLGALLAVPPTHLFSEQGTVGGLRVLVTVVASDDDYAHQAVAAVLTDVANTNALLSNHDSKSEIARINRSATVRPTLVMPEILAVLRRSVAVSRITDNAFALTLAPVTRLWGFDGATEPHVPADREIAAALRLVDDNGLKLQPNAIQLPGRHAAVQATPVLKGYAVDRALALLHNRGFSNALVDVHGDIGTLGAKPDGPWLVGIQDPRARGFFAVVALRDRVSATVGDYQSFEVINGTRYHHLLDPRTGKPSNSCRSVTVFGPDGVTASAFANAVFVLGPEAGMRIIEAREELDVVIVDRGNRVTTSSSLQIEIIRQPSL